MIKFPDFLRCVGLIAAFMIATPNYSTAEDNIAHLFGVATQGSTYGSDGAEKAIDGDENTINHTGCNATDNWWQVQLPDPSQISRIVVKSRSGWASRITDAEVYVTSAAYSGTLNTSDKVFTLAATSNAQEIALSPVKAGAYVTVKASGSNCLHMRELEVYGEVPVVPQFAEHATDYLIPHDAAINTLIASFTASDWQGDTINYSIHGNVPFTIDAQAQLLVNSALAPDSAYVFDVVANDGVQSAKTSITINTTAANAIELALQSGDVSDVTSYELLTAALAELQNKKSTPSLLTELYGVDPIDYTPGNRTQLINIDPLVENAFPILLGNKGKTLAMAGTTGSTRYAAYGMSPTELFQNGDSLSYEAPFNRLLAWLLAGEPIDDSALVGNKTIALSFANSDRNNIMAWIAAKHPTWTIKECNTVADLVNCYSSVDLIITGWQGADNSDATAVKQALATSMDVGKPVLYVHTWYEARNDVSFAIADLLNFSLSYGGNYWSDDAAVWDTAGAMQSAVLSDTGLDAIETMLQHLRDEDYVFDWSQCDGDNSCTTGSLQDTEFLTGAKEVRSLMQVLDINKLNIFAVQGFRYEKLLALIGDKFRQNVSYPMDKESTDDNAFMQSLFADNAVYNYRLLNPAQPDMGNFSRSDFGHIAATTRTVNLTSKKSFRSTGAYALPGQTFKVTRSDSSDLTVKVFINTLRSGATHLYEFNGYKRPKYLQSTYFEIAQGEILEITSPYGGPIQLNFDTNDLPVIVTFENVGEHAYWAGSTDDASFTTKLNAGDFDWAEVVTAGFEVHSKLDKMRTTIADAKWGDAKTLAAATERYMSNLPHIVAGFKGPGIDVIPEIHDFAANKGWTVDNLDQVKHMNADQATCGYGCSGNPYDAYWSYSPIGHGDVHELGHNLQGGKRFIGWENHSMTNHYAYYTKSKYNETVGSNADTCQSLSFENHFTLLQASVGQIDPVNYLQTNLWDEAGWNWQASMFIQMLMSAQNNGVVENGWHIRARLHIMEREFYRADNDEDSWLAKRAALGFSTYSLSEAESVDNNDWLLIAISTVTGMDYREYLKMWGIPFSAKAEAQVANYKFNAAPRNFYISDATGYCFIGQNGDFLGKAAVAIDGSTPWPTNTDTDGDGYWDAVDNCPADMNVDQLNTDADQLGNTCDIDDDNDGMPDSWELLYGFNPLSNGDASQDADHDGRTNLQEFIDGTKPNLNEGAINAITPIIVNFLLED